VAVEHVDPRSWRLLATPGRRAIAIGAAVQVLALAAYYGAATEVGGEVMLFGLVGGTVAAWVAPSDSGLWVEGLLASLAGCGLFLVGFFGWGLTRAAGFEPRVAVLVADAYLWVTAMKVLLFLPLFAGMGVIAGLVVGLVRRRVSGSRLG
jgi:hypothetical protein